jgi:Fic family protein
LLRREATASSRIEGTRTDLGQLFLYEATEERTDPSGDTREVLNYVRALAFALNRSPERPLTLQLIRELHALLMDGTRGDSKSPGEFRKVQNWIGGLGGIEQARYIPPPPEQVLPLMEDVVGYVNDPPHDIPELVRIALLHYQFEAIHPFEDGNGRLGRLIVVLLLAEWGLLSGPYLSISEVIEEHRSDYIDRLKSVSTHGDWEGWIAFFLAVVHEQAEREQRRVVQLMQLRERWRTNLQGSRSGAVLNIVDFAFERPVFTAKQVQVQIDYTYQAILNAIDRLVADGVLREITGQQRNRVFVADEVLAIVSPMQGRK